MYECSRRLFVCMYVRMYTCCDSIVLSLFSKITAVSFVDPFHINSAAEADISQDCALAFTASADKSVKVLYYIPTYIHIYSFIR